MQPSDSTHASTGVSGLDYVLNGGLTPERLYLVEGTPGTGKTTLGLGFLLADMDAAVESARATVLDAARRRDRGRPFGRQASIAKLVATDAAMRVTTDAVQVLGGAGYTKDFPVERMMREAKIMQIFEGTNQIQRLVIGRSLAR